MKRSQKILLGAAAAVVVTITGIVVTFGIKLPPGYPSLYDNGPTVAGTVAFISQDGNDCLRVLDVATGEKRTIICSSWIYLEGWNREGNLIIHSEAAEDRGTVIDPSTGQVLGRAASTAAMVSDDSEVLRTTSGDGHATLLLRDDSTDTILIDATGPRNYAFWDAGLVDRGEYAWVRDSDERLLLVATDGSAGPWVVLTDARDVAWR